MILIIVTIIRIKDKVQKQQCNSKNNQTKKDVNTKNKNVNTQDRHLKCQGPIFQGVQRGGALRGVVPPPLVFKVRVCLGVVRVRVCVCVCARLFVGLLA